MAMFCPQCGNQTAADAVFCSRCGSRVVAQTAARMTKPPELPGKSDQTQSASYLDLSSRTVWTRFFLFTFAGISAVGFALDLALLQLLTGANFTAEAAATNDARQQVFAALQLTVLALTVLAFSMWTYRANSNCRALGAQGMNFSPGWAVAWYFMPIAFLWKPYQAMKEIWQASKNPFAWQHEGRPVMLPWWWFFWVGNV